MKLTLPIYNLPLREERATIKAQPATPHPSGERREEYFPGKDGEAGAIPVVVKPVAMSWGWLPALSLTSAVGIFLVALAGNAGRAALQWADPLFWLGLLVLFVPIALRILSPKSLRWERIALLVVLGNSLYLIRDLFYPLSFAYNDEFLHWRGAQDIALSGHLFTANPLLPVGPFFPGIEILTNALSSLTGLSIFVSGMIVLSTAGLLLILSLYLFFEYLSSSARVAGLATLLYMANPGFFSETQFSYECLAIPLAAFVLFVTVRRNYALEGRRLGLTLVLLFVKLYDRLPKELLFIRELILSSLWRSPERWGM